MSRPKRVLFVITTSDYGGTETYVRQLIAKLDRRRFEPIFASLCPLGRIGRAIEETGTPTFSLGLSARTRLPELPGAVLRLRREIDRRDVDLVLGLLYRANALAAVACRISRRRPVFLRGQRSLNPPGAGLMVKAVQWTGGLAHHAIAVSPAVRDEMLATEARDRASITVVRNGVDLERWRPVDPAAARARFGLSPGAVVVVAAGRCTPVKGFHHLLRAVARARAGRPGAEIALRLAGDGPELAALESLRDELGLGGAAELVGRLDAEGLRQLYSAADVYALSSRAEGSPNAMLEAMACGCAVVATRVGGVLDILEDGESGVLVPPEDPEALATAIAELAGDGERRRRLAAGARRRIESDFSLDDMVAAHENLFERLS